MKQTLTTSQATHLLMQDENARWSYAGAHALVVFLEEFEASNETELTFDRVALRCEWHEYTSAAEAADDYCDWGFEGNESEREDAAMEWLRERTQVIEFDGGVIVQLF